LRLSDSCIHSHCRHRLSLSHIHTHGLRPELKTSSKARHVHDTTSCALHGPHFYFIIPLQTGRTGIFYGNICMYFNVWKYIIERPGCIRRLDSCAPFQRDTWRLPLSSWSLQLFCLCQVGACNSSCRLQLESAKTKHRQLKCLMYRVLYASRMHSLLHGLKLLVYEALSY